MKQWRILAVGSVMLATSALAAPQDEIPVKSSDGHTVAVIVLCNDCQTGTGKGCYTGAENGWLNGKPCGQCLLKANAGKVIEYGYDIHVTGTLVDPNGEAIKDRFIKLFMPNGWEVRTKTFDKGAYHMALGATAERKTKEPIVLDLGKRVDVKGADDANFAMLFLPPEYKRCPAEDGTVPESKPRPKKAKK